MLIVPQDKHAIKIANVQLLLVPTSALPQGLLNTNARVIQFKREPAETMMQILAWNGVLGVMLKIATITTVAIQDITGIITAQEEAVPTINLVLKTAATNTTATPMPIVQEEPVILLQINHPMLLSLVIHLCVLEEVEIHLVQCINQLQILIPVFSN
jgi:cytochrome b